MRELLERIGAEIEEAKKAREAELVILNDKIAESKKLMKECEEASVYCTIKGDSKGFKDAKAKYRDASDNVEVFTSRLEHIKDTPIISNEIASKYVEEIHEKQRSLYSGARIEVLKLFESIKEINEGINGDILAGDDFFFEISSLNNSILHPYLSTPPINYDFRRIDSFVKKNINFDFKEV